MAEKLISSSIVGPNGSHWCRVCKVYVRGTKISIREHEQTGRHKYNYRESLKEKQFLERKSNEQQNDVAAELRRMERDANRALGVPDIPSIALGPTSLRVHLPKRSPYPPPDRSAADDAPHEPFVPAYVPVVRAPSHSMYHTATPIPDATTEEAFNELTAPPQTAASTVGEAGEWTVVEQRESLETQQETAAAIAAAAEAQVEAAKRKLKANKVGGARDNDDDGDDDDDENEDDKGAIISGPRHLETAVASVTASATFKKRGASGNNNNRSVRKKLDDDDDADQ